MTRVSRRSFATRMHRHWYEYASIEFAQPTRFGRRITFVPDGARFLFLGHPELVMPDSAEALLRLAVEAKQRGIENVEHELRLRGL